MTGMAHVRWCEGRRELGSIGEIYLDAIKLSFRDLDESSEYLDDRVAWLNARQMPDHGQSRDERLQEELPHLLQLPPERYELCEWRRAKVAPDYHIRAGCMHHSVPFGLAGQTVDVGVTDSAVRVMHGGEVVAGRRRLRGRKGQHSTDVSHLPQPCRDAKSPWSRERSGSWADAVGTSTGACIRRILGSRPIAGQSFVQCRNVLGLAKRHSPEMSGRACGRWSDVPGIPSCTALKDTILAIRAEDAADAAAAPREMRDGRDVCGDDK